MARKENLHSKRLTRINFRVQRNGITDRVTVGMGEKLDVSNADSIEIVEVDVEVEGYNEGQ